MSMPFAATYPQRTEALVLCGAEVKEETTEDWPWGESTREEFEEYAQLDNIAARWGQGTWLDYIMPSRAGDERLRQLFGRLQKQSGSPADALAFSRMAFEMVAGEAVRGIAVHTGARVAAEADAGEVLVSQTVKDLVAGSGIELADRGVDHLKGIPGEWGLYSAT
jgi:hypothetical protein